MRFLQIAGGLYRFVLAGWLLMPGLSLADVWKYVDGNGVVHFSNVKQRQEDELVWLSSVAQSAAPAMARDGVGFSEAAANRAATVIEVSPDYHAVKGRLNDAAASFGVDLQLLKAVVAAESAFNPRAVSPKGAVGLMQVMPATARRYGVAAAPGVPVAHQLTDPLVNIRTGTRYLADLLRMFEGRVDLAVAAYNAGEGAVKRAGNQVPNYNETQHYVKKVMGIYRVLQTRAG